MVPVIICMACKVVGPTHPGTKKTGWRHCNRIPESTFIIVAHRYRHSGTPPPRYTNTHARTNINASTHIHTCIFVRHTHTNIHTKTHIHGTKFLAIVAVLIKFTSFKLFIEMTESERTRGTNLRWKIPRAVCD